MNLNQTVTPLYKPRGYIVQARNHKDIANEAILHFLSLVRHNVSLDNIERIVDLFAIDDDFNIFIHIEKNATWDKVHSHLKKGESIPLERKINLPKRVFDGIKKGNIDDLETLFHEIGHVVLKHQPIYMRAEGYIITELDDAEEQADYFAKIMLKLFDIEDTVREPRQLPLPFDE